MRDALYYSLYQRHAFQGWEVVAVTSERAGHWWGRSTRDNLGTHGKTCGLRGRFETEALALACRTRVALISGHYDAERRKLSDARSLLDKAERASIAAAVGAPMPGRDGAFYMTDVTVRIAE